MTFRFLKLTMYYTYYYSLIFIISEQIITIIMSSECKFSEGGLENASDSDR